MIKTPEPGSFYEQRSKGWVKLTAPELLVWIGITLKMGTLGRPRASHYWSQDEDFGNNIIKASMKENRYAAITANLSFAPRGTACGWAKISWLDELLRDLCRVACGITAHAAVDESMIKMLSKYCPWLQYMPKKPIKWGKCMCEWCKSCAYGQCV